MSDKKVKRFNNDTEKKISKKKLVYLIPAAFFAVVIVAAVIAMNTKPGPGEARTLSDASSNGTGQRSGSRSPAEKITTVSGIKKEELTVVTKPVAGGTISIPLAEVDDKKAHFYTYKSSTGKTIRFFVLKSGDDVYRAAFDACDVCFGAKKGYKQDGDVMVCNNCGQRFPSTRINVEKGGCNPAPLERKVVDSNLVFNKSDIETGLRYF